MSQFAINLLFVGGSFALYIGIAIWAKPVVRVISTLPAAAFTRSPTVRRSVLTGCPQHPLSPWRA